MLKPRVSPQHNERRTVAPQSNVMCITEALPYGGVGAAVNRAIQDWHRPPIMPLFKNRGPSAILWFVISVRVLTVKRHAFGSLTHILKEGEKAIAPSVAHAYPAPTIDGKFWGTGIEATRLRSSPRFVLLWMQHASSSRMQVVAIARAKLLALIGRLEWLRTVDTRTCRICVHLKLILSGVTGQDVSASLPFYFTRKQGRHSPLARAWAHVGDDLFFDQLAYRSVAPAC